MNVPLFEPFPNELTKAASACHSRWTSVFNSLPEYLNLVSVATVLVHSSESLICLSINNLNTPSCSPDKGQAELLIVRSYQPWPFLMTLLLPCCELMSVTREKCILEPLCVFCSLCFCHFSFFCVPDVQSTFGNTLVILILTFLSLY